MIPAHRLAASATIALAESTHEDRAASAVLAKEREAAEKAARKQHEEVEADRGEENQHLQIQSLLGTGPANHIADRMGVYRRAAR